MEIDVFHEIGVENRSIYDILADKIGTDLHLEIPDYQLIDTSFIQEELKRRENEIKTLRSNENKEIKANKIIGYDPMNSYGYGNSLVFKNFIMIKTGTNNQIVHGRGVATILSSDSVVVKIKE